MATAVAGKRGKTVIAGTACYNDRWKVTFHAVDIPTTNFESLGTDGATYEEGITGPYGADGEVSGYYDTDLAPFATPLFLFPGVYNPPAFVPPIVQNALALYTRKSAASVGTAGSQFTFPQIRILQSVVDVDVNGRINFAFSFKNNKQFTWPTL